MMMMMMMMMVMMIMMMMMIIIIKGVWKQCSRSVLKILGTVLLDETGKDESRATLTCEGLSNETDVQPLYFFMTY